MCECVASVAESESSPVPIHSATRGRGEGRTLTAASIRKVVERRGREKRKGSRLGSGLQSGWWIRPTLAASCGYVRMGAETP
jgi:hypothetical protein